MIPHSEGILECETCSRWVLQDMKDHHMDLDCKLTSQVSDFWSLPWVWVDRKCRFWVRKKKR